MGTIVARKRKDGSTGYTAQIIIKRKGHKPHREAKTFDRRDPAKKWIARRETELAAPGALDRAAKPSAATLAEEIDLRHDGVSRLFEMGRTVPLAANVSGHRSWASLQRSTHVRQEGDKYAGRRWLEAVTAP